jgi:MFS family permease
VLWAAAVPAFLSVALLVFGVREPGREAVHFGARRPFALGSARRLPLRFWFVVALGGVFTLARFSEAFLVLRTQEVGLALGYVPMVLIVMNLVYAAAAYPAGVASDRYHHRTLLIAGLGVLVAADLVLAGAASPPAAFVGAALWGLHMGLTQGLFAKLVAEAAPSELRGTAFGIFNVAGGGALMLASITAGWLWNAFGAPAAFLTGAGFAALAVLGLLARR